MNTLALRNKNKEDVDILLKIYDLAERFSNCHGRASLNDGYF